MINKEKFTEICNKYGVNVIDETVHKSNITNKNISASEQANKVYWEWKLAMGEFN